MLIWPSPVHVVFGSDERSLVSQLVSQSSRVCVYVYKEKMESVCF